jgi:hypothetical protein
MSDERPVFARWRCPFAGMLGNKFLIVEYFEARHWRLRYGMPVYPNPREVDVVDWQQMYRLRIDGRWFGPKKYSFYTLVESAMIVEKLINTERVPCKKLN